MATAVNEPYLLSSYTLPKRFTQPSSKSFSNVYATYQHASTSTAEGHVIVTAQGDGVHILDLSTLHPVVSHTLGPSTAFSCPSATRISDGGKTCTTYAVFESAQGVKGEEHGKVIRMWRDNTAGDNDTVNARVTAQTVTLPHRISQISAPDELPDSVLFIGQNGEITVTDQDLVAQHPHSSEEQSELIKSFVFNRSEATFVPRRVTLKDGAVVVSLLKSGDSVRLQVVGVDSSGVKTLANLVLPPILTALDASCSPLGFLSVLSPSGEWYSFQIECLENSTFTVTPASGPVTLRNLSFSSESTSAFSDEISLLSLGSSYVLLAGVSSASQPELALLLWDLQYSVVLASRTLAIPSTINRTKKQGIRLQLSGSSSGAQQALLILSPTSTSALVNGESHSTADDSIQRSSVLVVPLVVPVASSIASALGRASATEKWTVHAATNVSQANLASMNLEASQVKVLRAMRTAMEQRRVEAADEVFFDWVAQQEGGKPAAGRPNAKQPFGHQFVKQILDIILRTPKNATTDIPYSPKVMRYLMQQRVVSAGMIEGGLFAALRLRNDWESMMLSLKTVIDVPETDVVSLLHSSAAAARQKHADDSVMQIDATADSSVPALTSVLSLCTMYTMSAPALRLAIRQHLSDAAELTAILQMLNEWIDTWCAEDVALLPERTKKDLHGALIAVLEEKEKSALPPLEKVLAFLQTLLDSSFLTFLTFPPSHGILRDIFSHLEPELGFTDDVEQLRGPLEPFVRAHAKAVHEAAHGVQKPDLKVDWRKRRKDAHEQAGMAVGVYQIEELVL